MADFDALWSPAKVFSPTAAKQYSQSQKDWSYIDQFLSTRYAPTPVPSFERNPSTLSVLLALAAASEAADESHILTRRVKTKAQAELSALDAATTTISTSREPLLVALEEHLTPEGRRSLNSVALLSVALASPDADQRRLSGHLLGLAGQELLVAKQTERVDRLQTKLRGELDGLRASLRDLETGEEYQIPANLEAQTTDWMRGTRHLKNKAEDYREQLVQGAPRPPPMLSVPEVIKQEQEILALKERVMDLEGQVRAYQGLPPERDLARLEVERVQGELAELEGRREGMYDGMIGNSRQ